MTHDDCCAASPTTCGNSGAVRVFSSEKLVAGNLERGIKISKTAPAVDAPTVGTPAVNIAMGKICKWRMQMGLI